MKIVKYDLTSTEVEKSLNIENLQDLFEELAENFGRVDFTDEDVLEEIDDSNYIFSDDEMKQLPQLYNQWYLNNDYFQCKEEVIKTLDDLCKKYPNEDIESIIKDCFF